MMSPNRFLSCRRQHHRPTHEKSTAVSSLPECQRNEAWPGPGGGLLARDGLVDLIDARLCTSEMPFQKPDPSAFVTAAGAAEWSCLIARYGTYLAPNIPGEARSALALCSPVWGCGHVIVMGR